MSERDREQDWWPDEDGSVTQAYINAHWEFDWCYIASRRPYSGISWSREFKSISRSDAWGLRRDGIGNGLTADPIATVEALGLPHSSRVDGAGFRVYAEGMSAWLPVLDGGVYVNFEMWEHQYTNQVHGSQTTRVLGPRTRHTRLRASYV
jgi:hypothetical protein